MCDTMVALRSATADNSVIFAKNSDREPNEPHVGIFVKRKKHTEKKVKCTYIEIEQVPETYSCMLFKPSWIWGAEMGVNEYGVVIGNEAIFTKLISKEESLIGMDYVRLALERSKNAKEAVEVIINLIIWKILDLVIFKKSIRNKRFNNTSEVYESSELTFGSYNNY